MIEQLSNIEPQIFDYFGYEECGIVYCNGIATKELIQGVEETHWRFYCCENHLEKTFGIIYKRNSEKNPCKENSDKVVLNGYLCIR
jgi:hypothetical protein